MKLPFVCVDTMSEDFSFNSNLFLSILSTIVLVSSANCVSVQKKKRNSFIDNCIAWSNLFSLFVSGEQ